MEESTSKKSFRKLFFFVYQKKKKKKSRPALHEFFSTPNTSVQQVPQSPISKAMPPYLTVPSSSKNQPPDKDQQNGKRT